MHGGVPASTVRAMAGKPTCEVFERRSTEKDSRILVGLPLPKPAERRRTPTLKLTAGIGLGAGVGCGIAAIAGAHPVAGAIAGAALAGAAGVLAMALPVRRARRARNHMRERLQHHQAQVLTIRKARWLSLDQCGKSDVPILLAEVGPRKLLLLWGDCLREPSLYGCHDDAMAAATLNGLPAPFGFPCADFTLVRSVATGLILRIQPQSAPIEPPVTHVVFENDLDFPESCLFQGSIDDPLYALRPDHRLEVA